MKKINNLKEVIFLSILLLVGLSIGFTVIMGLTIGFTVIMGVIHG